MRWLGRRLRVQPLGADGRRKLKLEHVDDPESKGGSSMLDRATERIRAAREAAAADVNPTEPAASVITPSITSVDPSLVQPRGTEPQPETAAADQPPGKHDWL